MVQLVKYHNPLQSFKRKEIHIFKHLKKDSLKNIKNIKNLDYIILSNRAPDRIKFFKSLIKKATYIFENLYQQNTLLNHKKIFLIL